MRKLSVFNQVSADGFFVDRHGDMSWAKEGNDEEFNSFTSDNARGGGVLLFGRVTYDLMASFWPTPMAAQSMPVVADRMNDLPKIVFSRTMTKASWNNTTIVKGDLAEEVWRLKAEPGPGMVIMGSGKIISQLAPVPDLIDEYQFVVIPVVLGAGRSLFEGLEQAVKLKLTSSRTFKNGKVFLRYEPRAR